MFLAREVLQRSVTADGLRTIVSGAIAPVFARTETTPALTPAVARALRDAAVDPGWHALGSAAATEIVGLEDVVDDGSGTSQRYDLFGALDALDELLHPASDEVPLSVPLGADHLRRRMVSHAADFVALSVYEGMVAADPTLEPADRDAGDAFLSVAVDFSRAIEAISSTSALLLLELEATIDRLVELRRTSAEEADRSVLDALRVERQRLARRAILIDNEILIQEGDPASLTALDRTIIDRLAEIEATSTSERDTVEELGDGVDLLAPRPLELSDRILDPTIDDSGLAAEPEAHGLEPQDAFPEQTTAFQVAARRTITDRIRDQEQDLLAQLDLIAPAVDRATFTIEEFLPVHRHWHSLFSGEAERSNEQLQTALEFWRSMHQVTGMGTTNVGYDAMLGALRIGMMEDSFRIIGMHVGTNLDDAFQGVVDQENVTRDDELSGSGASDAGYETAEFFGPAGERSIEGERSSRTHRRDQRSSDTAGSFSSVAGEPVAQQTAEAHRRGLTEVEAPVRNLRSVEAREGWSYLADVRDDDGNVIAYEHKVAAPEVAEALLAQRQRQRTRNVHLQYTSTALPRGQGAHITPRLPVGMGSNLLARPLEGTSVGAGPFSAPGGSRRAPSGTSIVQQRLNTYLDTFFRREDPAPRLMGLFALMDAEHGTGKLLDEAFDPTQILKVVAQSVATGAGLSALSAMGPLGKLLAKGVGDAMKLVGSNDVAAAMGVAKFIRMAITTDGFHAARTLGYMGAEFAQDIKSVFEAMVSYAAERAATPAGAAGGERLRQHLEGRPPRTIAEAAEMARVLGDVSPAAQENLLHSVDEIIQDRRTSGDSDDVDLHVMIAFRNALMQRSESDQRFDPFETHISGREQNESPMPLIDGIGLRPRSEMEALREALGPLRSEVELVTDVALSRPDLAASVRVYYNRSGVRVHVGPQARAADVRGHLPTVRALQRYTGVGGRIRSLVAGLTNLGPPAGTLGHEARLELEKLGRIRDELVSLETSVDRGARQASDGTLTQAQIDARIAEIDAQFVTHFRNINSTERGRGYVAAHGAVALDPQTRRVTVSQPHVLAEYERLADRKMHAIVTDVFARQGSTPTRQRLATLRTDFDAFTTWIGSRTSLTPTEHAEAMTILREARKLARRDFSNLRRSVWGRLRADPDLEALATQLRAAGDAQSRGQSGSLRVRTSWNDGRTGFQALELEHKTRLSDDPWRYNDPDNLILTDSSQNQQFLEALRRHGGIWAAGGVEAFVTAHGLTDQASGYGAPATQESSAR